MHSTDLTTDQLDSLRSSFVPMLEYLTLLEQRMYQRKFRAR